MRLSLFAAAALLACSFSAHADTIFNLNATIDKLNNGDSRVPGGGTATGSFTFDTATDEFTAGLVNLTLDGEQYTFDQVTDAQNNVGTYYLYLSNPATPVYLRLEIPDAASNSLAGYSGGQVQSDSYYSQNPSYVYNPTTHYRANVTYGTLETAMTPEPSGFALLGTGVLGLAGIVRKRFV